MCFTGLGCRVFDGEFECVVRDLACVHRAWRTAFMRGSYGVCSIHHSQRAA